MWIWIISLLLLIIVGPIIIFKLKKRKEESYLDLDSRLTGVKSFWDKCCSKVKSGIGI